MAIYIKKGKNDVNIEGFNEKVQESVKNIIKDIENRGDKAVQDHSMKFDQWNPDTFLLSKEKVEKIIDSVPENIIKDIQFAQEQIKNFALKQKNSIKNIEVETMPGVILGHKNIPVNRVGCYIPGGRYPMIASSHMSILTAKVAGVKHIIACTPPSKGNIPAETVAAMHMAGADDIYIMGGIQAMTAMAIGTETIEPVDMIVGPGNQFVAEAKRQLFGKVGIDLFAGPTETLIIADETSDVEIIATDLLGQAEHGPNSPCALITTSKTIAESLEEEIALQLESLSTAKIAREAWENYGSILLVEGVEEAVIEADNLAYEHVQIFTKNPDYFLESLTNYGAMFLGQETTVAYGDKVIGTNHTLPTRKAARYTGGLWVGKFMKNSTYQKITKEASVEIGQYAERLCELEGFVGHKKQASLRIRRYSEE